MKRIAVGDIMTRNLITVSPQTNLSESAKKMVKNRVNTLLVIEKNHLIGIITARDILWTITKKPNLNLKEIRAIDIATRKVAVIKPSADISQALRKMKAYNFRRLPVISKGELIGVITIKDILRIEPELYKEITDIMEIKEEDRKIKDAVGTSYPAEGLCDNCGAFAPLLRVYDQLLCPDCREELY